MTAKISEYKDLYYHREYWADIGSLPIPVGIERIAAFALPFLSLYRPFQFPISLVMSTSRVWSAKKIIDNRSKQNLNLTFYRLQAVMAVIALAATVFRHPMGMMVTTSQDIAIGLKLFIQCIKEGEKKEAVFYLASIINNTFYLALLCRGGLELSLISLTMQTLFLVVSSMKEFKKGNWLESCGRLLMAAIRLRQGYSQYEQLRRKWEIEAAVKRVFVGELHEKWQFPSDHLPVGIEVNGVKIISWNVLNNLYMEWVTTKDSQGLKGSLISDLDKPVQENGLTMRDLHIIEMIQQMTNSGQVIALQECGAPFLEALQQRLPSNWELVKSFEGQRKDQDVILYNTSQLTYHSEQSEVTTTSYPSVPNRPIQQVVFSKTDGSEFSIINAHIPGDPSLPSKEEFSQYVYKKYNENNIPTIAVGDYNFERDEMIDSYKKAGFQNFSFHSTHKTNIDPYNKNSKAIDHQFVIGENVYSRDLTPNEILPNDNRLPDMINLLNSTV